MKRRLSFFGYLITLIMIGASVQASDFEPAVIVNDTLITRLDIEERVRAIASLSNVTTQDGLSALTPQVIQSMVSEQVKRQTAEMEGITASPADINNALQAVAQNYRLSINDLSLRLAEAGASISTITDQLQADIVWNQYINSQAPNAVVISADEISLAKDLWQQQQENQEQERTRWRLQRIFLPIDATRPRAEQLIAITRLQTLLANGADFGELSRSVSDDFFAANRGEMGWFRPNELSPPIFQAVQSLNTNDVSSIVETDEGVALYRVIERDSPPRQPLTDDLVRQRLRLQALETLSRRILLRQRLLAFIDIRL